MNNLEFDLNIHNYNIGDLEKLFKLNSDLKYSTNDIEYKEYQLREQLFKTGYINKALKPNIVQFLSLAKTRLIQVKCAPTKKPSIVSESWQLDKTNIPRLDHTTSRESELVIKQPTSYTYIKPSDYFQGTLNPLEKRVITKNISIDTLFRNNYSATNSADYIYTLPEPLNNITSMKLTALELANSWYSFSAKNNTNVFWVNLSGNTPLYIITTETTTAGITTTTMINSAIGTIGVVNITSAGTTTTVTTSLSTSSHSLFNTGYYYKIVVPDGNYLSTDFSKTINAIFAKTVIKYTIDTYSGALSNYIKLNINEFSTKTFFINSISVDTIVSIYFCDPVLNPNITEEISNTQLNKTMGWMMGFRKPYYKMIDISNNPLVGGPDFGDASTQDPTSTYNQVCNGYIESEGSFGSLIDNYIFLDVDDFHNNYPTNTIISTNNTNQSYLGTNILARISITVGLNVTLNDTGLDQICKRREYFGPIKLEKLRIRLLNRFGDLLDINNNDYSLLLEFTQMYS